MGKNLPLLQGQTRILEMKKKKRNSEEDKVSKEQYSQFKKRLQEQYTEFQRIVSQQFEFLISEYGFIASDFEKCRSSDPRDKEISVVYMGQQIAIQISWLINEGGFSVFIYELVNGAIPSRNSERCRPVDIELFVEYVTSGEVKSVLPHSYGDISTREIYRRATKSYDLLENSFNEIVSEYAARLKRYCDNILNGDISVLPEAQQYQLKRFSEGDYRPSS